MKRKQNKKLKKTIIKLVKDKILNLEAKQFQKVEDYYLRLIYSFFENELEYQILFDIDGSSDYSFLLSFKCSRTNALLNTQTGHILNTQTGHILDSNYLLDCEKITIFNNFSLYLKLRKIYSYIQKKELYENEKQYYELLPKSMQRKLKMKKLNKR